MIYKTKINFTLVLALISLVITNCGKPKGPIITSVDPAFGPAETLVTFEGENLANILELRFNDQVVNFNTAYNSDNALLFRTPENLPLGDHVVTFETEGGTATTEFRVTLEAPEIYRFEPESADVGEEITIYGENFFEPLEVYFFDSIQAEIIMQWEDSVRVVVPSGVQKGPVTVVANGGIARSPVQFFSTNTILINDFDGNGVRSETNSWIFVGSVDQNADTAVQNMNPAPYDGDYLKLTGADDLNIGWIGGCENHSWDTDVFENYGITTSNNNTLFEMDVHVNGNEHTYVIIIMLERDGSPNDFAHQIQVTGEGWQKISLPLNRFSDLNDVLVDPAKIKTVKLHLNNTDDVNSALELNVDNMQFIEIL